MSLSDTQQLWTGLGAAFSILLCSAGSAIASVEAGVYCLRKRGYSAFVPIVISGVLALYGIIVAVLLVGKMEADTLNGYRNLCAGLSVGFACFASGLGISKFLKQLNTQAIGVPASSSSSSEMTQALLAEAVPDDRRMSPAFTPVVESFIHLTMVLVYLEAIGLYGLIVALLLIGK